MSFKVTRTSRFDFGEGPDADSVFQWDTKRKLCSLVEVCAILSAVLVLAVFVKFGTSTKWTWTGFPFWEAFELNSGFKGLVNSCICTTWPQTA